MDELLRLPRIRTKAHEFAAGRANHYAKDEYGKESMWNLERAEPYVYRTPYVFVLALSNICGRIPNSSTLSHVGNYLMSNQ